MATLTSAYTLHTIFDVGASCRPMEGPGAKSGTWIRFRAFHEGSLNDHHPYPPFVQLAPVMITPII